MAAVLRELVRLFQANELEFRKRKPPTDRTGEKRDRRTDPF